MDSPPQEESNKIATKRLTARIEYLTSLICNVVSEFSAQPRIFSKHILRPKCPTTTIPSKNPFILFMELIKEFNNDPKYSDSETMFALLNIESSLFNRYTLTTLHKFHEPRINIKWAKELITIGESTIENLNDEITWHDPRTFNIQRPTTEFNGCYEIFSKQYIQHDPIHLITSLYIPENSDNPLASIFHLFVTCRFDNLYEMLTVEVNDITSKDWEDYLWGDDGSAIPIGLHHNYDGYTILKRTSLKDTREMAISQLK